MKNNHQKFTQDCINQLVELKTVRGLTEAIAICLGNLKNDEGKLVGRIILDEDFTQNMKFCLQIAEMLMDKKLGETL